MHLRLLLLGFLLLTTALAHAQGDYEQLSSKQFKQQLRQQYLHKDTAQAIINLYGRRGQLDNGGRAGGRAHWQHQHQQR